MGTTSYPTSNGNLTTQPSATTGMSQRDLIVGQMGANGQVGLNTYVKNVHTYSYPQLAQMFGKNSDLYNQIIYYLNITKGNVPLDVIQLPAESGAIAATAIDVLTIPSSVVNTINVSSTSGTFDLVPIDAQFQISMAISSGQSISSFVTNLQDLIDSFANLPATATVVAVNTSTTSTITITWTASDKGTIGNTYRTAYFSLPVGVSLVQTGWNGGAVDPITTTALDPIENVYYGGICWRWFTTWQQPDTLLSGRNALINGNLWHGMSYMGYDDTYTGIINTFANNGTPLNTQNTIFLGNNTEQLGSTTGATPQPIFNSVIATPSAWRAAAVMGIHSYCLTEGTAVAAYRQASADFKLDMIGGVSQSSLAWYNIPLTMVTTTPADNLFSKTQQNALVTLGYSIIGVNSRSNAMITGVLVTPYATDSNGEADISYHYLNFIDQAYNGLYILETEFTSLTTQARISTSTPIPGRNMQDTASMKGELCGIYKQLGSSDYVLCDVSNEAMKAFDTNTTVTNPAIGTINVSTTLYLLTQVLNINYVVGVNFNFSVAAGVANSIQ